MWTALLRHLPRGHTLDVEDWKRRHRLLEWVLVAHLPALGLFGWWLGESTATMALALIPPALCLLAGHHFAERRRLSAVMVTAGLVYCSGALVGLSSGAIEAHFHFFIIIGFIALYQDWAPFLFNILFTVLSHGIGSVWQNTLIFSHPAGQENPWLWSLIHGVAVLFACVGMLLFWRITEESQREKNALATQLADAEIGRRQFTSELLVNLARRNQSMLYRQLDIINQLEETEQDPDALAELFRLDHLATRVRRNAESLLVLSGEQPPRVWGEPVPLRDVVRAAIAETEDLERVVFTVDERISVSGHTVTDLTHLLAELTENAVRCSPPDTVVTLRARSNPQEAGGELLTVEDWGVGMPPVDLATANELLSRPPEVDLSVSQRLGFHVVARLAARHDIRVSLSSTPGSGITAVVVLPAVLFAHGREAAQVGVPAPRHSTQLAPEPVMSVSAAAPMSRAVPAQPTGSPWTEPPPTPPMPARAPTAAVPSMPARAAGDDSWQGWWDPAVNGAAADGSAGFGVPANGHAAAPAGFAGPGNGQYLNGSGKGFPGNGQPGNGPSTQAGNGLSGSGQRSAAAGTGTPGNGHRLRESGNGGLGNGGPGNGGPGNGHRAGRPGDGTTYAGRPAPQGPVDAGADQLGIPAPRPRPAMSSPPAPAASGGAPNGLRRRVPQANLAPELREPVSGPEPAAPVAGNAAAAANALSRYQASREAAQAAVGDEPLGHDGRYGA